MDWVSGYNPLNTITCPTQYKLGYKDTSQPQGIEGFVEGGADTGVMLAAKYYTDTTTSPIETSSKQGE